MKITNKMVDRFLQIMDEYDEFVFGDKKSIKNQLELCLKTQGYWSGCSIRIYYNEDLGDFAVASRF